MTQSSGWSRPFSKVTTRAGSFIEDLAPAATLLSHSFLMEMDACSVDLCSTWNSLVEMSPSDVLFFSQFDQGSPPERGMRLPPILEAIRCSCFLDFLTRP